MNRELLKPAGTEAGGETNRVTTAPVDKITHTGTTGGSPPGPGPGRRQARWLLAVAALAVGAAYGGQAWWRYAHTWVSTDNAYLAGHIHTVSPRIAGTVTEVLVNENEAVAAGAVLARLDANDLQVQREKLQAARAEAGAQAAQAQAQVAKDEAVAKNARLDFERADRLFKETSKAISQQEFDSARAALDAATASSSAAQAAVTAAAALIKAADAQLKEIELQLSYTEIRAPAAGRIGRKNLEVGNRVQSGQSLLAVVQPEVWVTANFKETQLARLHAGQPVTVRVDSIPGRTFAGRVESIAPASGAQFALLPPDNATGNFTKIVQRVPVKIVFTDETPRELAGRLSPGLSAVVKVKVGGA